VKLNSALFTQAEFLDREARRGERYEYQIEELRANGTRFIYPPQECHIGVLPSFAYLRQNYPNPFNGSTTVIYGVPSAGHATIRLYNVLGQHVRTLVDAQTPQGEFKVSWDGRDQRGRVAASGVYFVAYTTETQKLTSRILLIR
jgi:hypothetical protein